jgi:GNAT superfamily N-acetyltransferase
MNPEPVDPIELAQFAASIPEMEVGVDIGNRWKNENWNCLAVRKDGRIISYMVGKLQSDGTYFIWLCGTSPEARGMGCASMLIKAHEEIAQASGCELVAVDSKNKYPGMLITLIKAGYKIYNLKLRDADDRHSIQFHKMLANKAVHRTP